MFFLIKSKSLLRVFINLGYHKTLCAEAFKTIKNLNKYFMVDFYFTSFPHKQACEMKLQIKFIRAKIN